MRQFLIAACTSAAMATAGCAAPQLVLPKDMRGQVILYVGAHPDDEWGMVPILADACIDRGATCRFVVVSEAKSYGCLLTIQLQDPEECSRRRRIEMQQAAAMFRGTVEFMGLEDLFYAFNQAGMDHVIADWSSASGGRNALVGRFERILRRERPSLVLTFDPRHGSSCHSAHRATATLLTEAVRRLPPAEQPPVWMEQTVDIEERVPGSAEIIDAGGYVGWPDTAAETSFYDATRPLIDGRTGYDYVIEERKIHASQVPDEASGAKILNPPMASRRVPLARLEPTTSGDFCTALDLDRPTFDIPANRQMFGIEP